MWRDFKKFCPRFGDSKGHPFDDLLLFVKIDGRSSPAKVDTGQDYIILPRSLYPIKPAVVAEKFNDIRSCKICPDVSSGSNARNVDIFWCRVEVDGRLESYRAMLWDLKEEKILLGKELLRAFELKFENMGVDPGWDLKPRAVKLP